MQATVKSSEVNSSCLPLTLQGAVKGGGDFQPKILDHQAEAGTSVGLLNRRWGHRGNVPWANEKGKKHYGFPLPLGLSLISRHSFGQALPEVKPLLDIQSKASSCPEFQSRGEGWRMWLSQRCPKGPQQSDEIFHVASNTEGKEKQHKVGYWRNQLFSSSSLSLPNPLRTQTQVHRAPPAYMEGVSSV